MLLNVPSWDNLTWRDKLAFINGWLLVRMVLPAANAPTPPHMPPSLTTNMLAFLRLTP
jgi:hypothetical protein